jgi:hypothetical protein
MQGGFGSAPDPYHLPIKNAYNWVIGEIPGAVLQADGQLMNKDSASVNWAPWQLAVGNHDDALQMLRATTALRRGAGKPFLVYGRMLAPAHVESIQSMHWQADGRDHRIPAVFHATWQAPDGHLGWALANWTNQAQEVSIIDPRLGATAKIHLAVQQLQVSTEQITGNRLAVHMPPLSCMLIESLL